jgi:hypothetical protein
MPNVNRPSTQDRYRKAIAAIPQFLSAFAQIVLAGVTFTPASLVQFFQGQITVLDNATQARSKLHEAVLAVENNHAQNGAVLRAFSEWIRATFINQPSVMSAFAVSARVAPPKTAEQKAQAAAKRAATRKARNVMGKKQRLAVKGAVPQPAAANGGAAPTAAPNAAAPAASPAGPAPAGAPQPPAPGGNGSPPPAHA